MVTINAAKTRLESTIARLETASARLIVDQSERTSLRLALEAAERNEQLLRMAAADALAEVDQAIALIAAQVSTEGETIDRAPTLTEPTMDGAINDSIDQHPVSTNDGTASDLFISSSPGSKGDHRESPCLDQDHDEAEQEARATAAAELANEMVSADGENGDTALPVPDDVTERPAGMHSSDQAKGSGGQEPDDPSASALANAMMTDDGPDDDAVSVGADDTSDYPADMEFLPEDDDGAVPPDFDDVEDDGLRDALAQDEFFNDEIGSGHLENDELDVEVEVEDESEAKKHEANMPDKPEKSGSWSFLDD